MPITGTTPTQNKMLIAVSSALTPREAMLPTRNGPIAAIIRPVLYVNPAPVPQPRREKLRQVICKASENAEDRNTDRKIHIKPHVRVKV